MNYKIQKYKRWASNRIKAIKTAKETGFKVIMEKPEQMLLRFRRDEMTVDVWFSRMTVGVYSDENDNARYLYDVSPDDLFELMMSPSTYKHDGRVKDTYKYNKDLK